MNKINGFLHAQGTKIADGNNEEIILTGWGLGNWLLQEGYMWQAANVRRFDRPRRIEQVLNELTGSEYAEKFWKTFRDNYVNKKDIEYLAELGYNSVRIPINWRILMEEGEGIVWKEEGFVLLDRCLKWCEDAGIYAFLDLHGAPGGQTGANIDDSIDDVPRLFIDSDSREKCLAIWKKLAARYVQREVVGGYDLLNEPIAPPTSEIKDFDYLIPELASFYKEAAALIRQVDKNHLLSIEGAHWATDTGIFEERFDDNMVLHFHRYAEKPEKKCLDPFLLKSEELDIPLWLGETGENTNEWYAALYPLAMSLGIGINLWPWKKLDACNGPCSIRRPKDYDLILEYIKGGKHPGFQKAREVFDEYLENIRFENCTLHPEVTSHVFRKGKFALRAVDFDEMPGAGISFSAVSKETPGIDYRKGCGMKLVETEPEREPVFVFDSGWDRYALIMGEGEFAAYTIEGCGDLTLRLELEAQADVVLLLETEEDSKEVPVKTVDKMAAVKLRIPQGRRTAVKVAVVSGTICLKRLMFEPDF